MGSQDYERDVYTTVSSTGFTSGKTSSGQAKRAMSRREMSRETDPYGRVVVSTAAFPIGIVMDGTGSNIEFARIFWDKSPLLHREIVERAYLPEKAFDICLSVVGDAYCDNAPLQIAEFAYGIDIDTWLKRLWLESGGGGQQKETYELAAYAFTHRCEMPNAKQPYLFIIGDEAPYQAADSGHLQQILGIAEVTRDIPTGDLFAQMLRVYKGYVFVLLNNYCGDANEKTATERIHQQWVNLLGWNHLAHVIHIEQEKSIVDLMLGIIAMGSGTRTLETYLADMVDREQTPERVTSVQRSLAPLAGKLGAGTFCGEPGQISGARENAGWQRF